MGIIAPNKRKFRPLAAAALVGIIGLTGVSLAPAAVANGYPVQVIKIGPVSKDYWDVLTYKNTPFATSQDCVVYAESKLRPKTWAQCVYAEYQGQSGWYVAFSGTNQ